MVTFRVDDVVVASERLPTSSPAEIWPEAMVFGADPALRLLTPDGVHPLLSAVGRAFADHRRLVLSPDVVWLTIAQGIAQHIRLHAEELRSLLVSHEGRKRLELVLSGPMPVDAASWQAIVEQLGDLLAAEAKATDLFECDFSTSTSVERTAARVVMLDAYAPFFSVWLYFVCGIPSITLTGSPDDWRRIRERVDIVATLGLQTWCRSLAPILDQFVRASEGDVDTAFWKRIYSPVDAYGGDVINGWAARFYPYLRGHDALDVPNRLLDLGIDEPRNTGSYGGPGIKSTEAPATLSKVSVNVVDAVVGEHCVMTLHAGVVGVCQDDEGSLHPVAGWFLAPESRIDDVIDRIIAEHQVTAPHEGKLDEGEGDLDTISAETVALYRRIGSASSSEAEWRILPKAETCDLSVGEHEITTMIELPDGRRLGSFWVWDQSSTDQRMRFYWVAAHVEREPEILDEERYRLAEPAAEVKVYGTSLAAILDRLLGPDKDLADLETCRLTDLLRADA